MVNAELKNPGRKWTAGGIVVDTGAAIAYSGQKRRILRHFLMITSGSKQTAEELGGTLRVRL